jgi:hypothetical protein
MARLRTVNEYLEAGVKIGLILAGIFAGLQYCSSIETRRVERVLDYAREFDSGELLQAQRRIDRALVAMTQRVEADPADRPGAVAREEREIRRRILQDVDGLGSDLALVLGFMEKLNACQRKDVCNADLAREYFQPYAAGLAVAFQCHLIVERRRRDGYGNGLLAIGRISTLDDAAARRCPDRG